MYNIRVRPKLGQELQKQQTPSNSRNYIDRRLSAFLYSSIGYCVEPASILIIILAGCTTLVVSGCGGLVLNPAASGSPSDAASRKSKPSISSVSCGTGSLTGAQTKACSIYLSSAPTSNFTVNLTSSNKALSVPKTVTVFKGATYGGFTAVFSGVKTAQSATITASATNTSRSTTIQLYPAQGSTSSATLSKISCGAQTLTGSVSKACSIYLSGSASSDMAVSLTSSSKAVVVPSRVTIYKGATSAGFSAVASAVSSSQTVTLTANAGGVTQTTVLQLYSSSASSPTTQHEVDLTWNPPTNTSDPVAGYNIYRATGGSTSYSLLNSSQGTQTGYADTTVQSGTTYGYQVRTVDYSGKISTPSNTASVTIP